MRASGRLKGGYGPATRRCTQLHRPFGDFARIDRRVVNGAVLLDFISNQAVALAQQEDAELFDNVGFYKGSGGCSVPGRSGAAKSC